LGNASYHKGKASLAALSFLKPRVRAYWLPKHYPNLNPIERFWRNLKDLTSANELEIAMENLLHRIEEILSFQNSDNHHLK